VRFGEAGREPPRSPLQPDAPAEAAAVLGHSVALLADADAKDAVILGVRRGDDIPVTVEVGFLTSNGLVVVSTTRNDVQTVLSTLLRANISEGILGSFCREDPARGPGDIAAAGQELWAQPTAAVEMYVDGLACPAVELLGAGFRALGTEFGSVNIVVTAPRTSPPLTRIALAPAL